MPRVVCPVCRTGFEATVSHNDYVLNCVSCGVAFNAAAYLTEDEFAAVAEHRPPKNRNDDKQRGTRALGNIIRQVNDPHRPVSGTFLPPASPTTRTCGLPFREEATEATGSAATDAPDELQAAVTERIRDDKPGANGTGAFLITSERKALSVALIQSGTGTHQAVGEVENVKDNTDTDEGDKVKATSATATGCIETPPPDTDYKEPERSGTESSGVFAVGEAGGIVVEDEQPSSSPVKETASSVLAASHVFEDDVVSGTKPVAPESSTAAARQAGGVEGAAEGESPVVSEKLEISNVAVLGTVDEEAEKSTAEKETGVKQAHETEAVKRGDGGVKSGRATRTSRPPLLEGAFGPFDIESEIARGGVGAVFKVRERSTGDLAALKVLLDDEDRSAVERERFRRECETARSLALPGMVKIHAVGEVDGKPYMAMEYVEGRSLDRIIPEKSLSTNDALVMIRAVAETVGALHEAGYVHRDLKPGNILVDRLGTPKVADFGLVKSLDEVTRLTASGLVCGTPAYMAPEQARGDGDAIDPRADVWALGAVLYEIMAGRPPFKAENALRLMLKITREEPTSLKELNPKVPADVVKIVRKCLAKKRERRYANARELADDIGRFLDGRPITARTQPTMRQALRAAGENRRLLAAVGGGLAALLFVGVSVRFLFAPESPTPYLQHGLKLLARRPVVVTALKEAESEFRRALSLNERLAPALIGLGRVVGVRSVDPTARRIINAERFKEAQEYLARAAKLDPKTAGKARTWAARLYMNVKDFKAEVRQRELAVRTAPDNAAYHHDLALAYWNAGYRAKGEERRQLYERAAEEFNRTLALQPDHPKTAEYLRLLQKRHLARRSAFVPRPRTAVVARNTVR